MSDNPYNCATEKMMIPRQYSFVKFDFTNLPVEYHQGYLFSAKHRYIFLGEIPNMPGHCVVTDENGKMYAGYHTENFKELTDDDIDDFWPVGYNPK